MNAHCEDSLVAFWVISDAFAFCSSAMSSSLFSVSQFFVLFHVSVILLALSKSFLCPQRQWQNHPRFQLYLWKKFFMSSSLSPFKTSVAFLCSFFSVNNQRFVYFLGSFSLRRFGVLVFLRALRNNLVLFTHCYAHIFLSDSHLRVIFRAISVRSFTGPILRRKALSSS